MKPIQKAVLFALVLLLILAIPNIAYANSAEIRVFIDDDAVGFDQPPQIIAGRTMVPMRAIFEAMGAEVEWDEVNQIVIAHTLSGCIIRLTVGSTELFINNIASQMDIAPLIIGDRTLVPARFVAQALGHEVVWDAANSTVLINTDPFTRLNPLPVTLGNAAISWRDLGSWIIHYLYTGGISDLEREVIALVNLERERVGAPPVAICPALSAAARFKSQEMADLGYFAHESPVYGEFFNIPELLFGAYHVVSENLARRVQVTDMAASIMRVLYDSPGHRANMLYAGHNVIGVGVVMSMGAGVNFDGTPITDRYAALATQMFGYLAEDVEVQPIMDRYIKVFTNHFGLI